MAAVGVAAPPSPLPPVLPVPERLRGAFDPKAFLDTDEEVRECV
jgi:hypothetical protein